MIYYKGASPKFKGHYCKWCGCPIRHTDPDPNNGVIGFGPSGTEFFVHKLCVTSWASTHAPGSLQNIKMLIND